MTPKTPRYHIFLSYRREDGKDIARMLKESLVRKGYTVFLDLDELQDGIFDNSILRAIDAAPIYMLLMTEQCFDRCGNPNDWVRQEIEYALSKNKVIIPINPDRQFKAYPNDMPDHLRSALSTHQYSAIDTGQLYQESVDKLVYERIKPVVGIKHKALLWAIVLFFVTLVPYMLAYYCFLPGYYIHKGDKIISRDTVTLEDTLDAIKHYKYAIKAKKIEGYGKIGDLYYQGILSQNRAFNDSAYMYYRLGAYAGDGYSQTRYALCLKDFYYIETRQTQNPDSAFYWANKAYQSNAPQSANTLAQFYATGFGIVEDRQRAIELYKEGLSNGECYHGLGNSASVELSLGMLLDDIDYVESITYLLESYKKNNILARFFLQENKCWVVNPIVDSVSTNRIQVRAISWDNQDTLRLYLEWFNTKYYGGWMQIDSSAFVENNRTKERYRVSALSNCKFSPDTTKVPWGKSHKFTLSFAGVPDTITSLNFCESDTSDWKMYGINIQDKIHIKPIVLDTAKLNENINSKRDSADTL